MSFKRFSTYTILLGISTLLSGCFEAPDFSNTPEISFDEVVFLQGNAANQVADTLRITINYQDGDGDLGLNSELSNTLTFTPVIYFTKQSGEPVSISDEGLSINVAGFSGTEVPPYVDPYICENWEIIPGDEPQDPNKDTVFFVNNINSKNIFVKLLKEEGSIFEEVDWSADPFDNCISPLNAAFPVLKDLSESSAPINGSLTYAFGQFNIFGAFGDDNLKLEILIQDRELNKSNTVTTEAFTLASIRGN